MIIAPSMRVGTVHALAIVSSDRILRFRIRPPFSQFLKWSLAACRCIRCSPDPSPWFGIDLPSQDSAGDILPPVACSPEGVRHLPLEGDPDAICVAILCPNLNRLIQPTKSSPAAQFPAPLFQSHEHGLLREVERLNRLWKLTFARSTKPRSFPRTKNSSWQSKLAKAT